MTREEMDRILGVDPKDVWVPDFDYGEEISEEENEELTRILENLTEDDLQTARTRVIDRFTGKVIEEIIYTDVL